MLPIFCPVDTEHILDLLRVIQSLTPSGIGARNLSECLLIQLEHMDIKDNVLETMSFAIIWKNFHAIIWTKSLLN